MTVNGPQGLTPRIETVTDTSYRTDQNNVNVDIEMSELAKIKLSTMHSLTKSMHKFLD